MISYKLCKNIVFNTLKKHMFWIFVRIASKRQYPKHLFYEEIRTKQDLSCILICSLRILNNNKFILVATSLGTNAVVLTRVHCISFTWVNTRLGYRRLHFLDKKLNFLKSLFFFSFGTRCCLFGGYLILH